MRARGLGCRLSVELDLQKRPKTLEAQGLNSGLPSFSGENASRRLVKVHFRPFLHFHPPCEPGESSFLGIFALSPLGHRRRAKRPGQPGRSAPQPGEAGLAAGGTRLQLRRAGWKALLGAADHLPNADRNKRLFAESKRIPIFASVI